VPYSGT
jgi:hypothetical protein